MDEDSVPCIVDDSELVDVTRSVTADRKTQDVRVICAVLDNGTTALSEGAL